MGDKLTEKILKKEYAKRKTEIKSRLKEFAEVGKRNAPEELFIELCFCLCTPQSKAEKVNKIIHSGNKKILINKEQEIVCDLLRGNCRFHNNKSRYIVDARKIINELKHLSKNPIITREKLVKDIKGLGYKEASHFLRNIGYRNICIIDRHIVNTLSELNVLKKEFPKNGKQYLEIESKIKNYAKKIKINVDELDLLLWAIKTGYILK